MRRYLVKKKTYSAKDLRRLSTDAWVNAARAKTPEVIERNYSELRAIDYVLYLVENGHAPRPGRPTKRQQFYLNKTTYAKLPPKRGEFI